MPWKVAVQIRTVCACVYVCVCAHTCVYTHIGKQFRERFTDAPESRAVLPTLRPSLEKLLRLAGREHYLPGSLSTCPALPPSSLKASLTDFVSRLLWSAPRLGHFHSNGDVR